MTTRTPRAVAELLLDGIGAGRWAELAELYAHDAVVDMPMAAPKPVRIEGRDVIRGHFTAAASSPLRFTVHNLVVHETTDPEVVITEFEYRGELAGRPFAFANVQLLRVRDGLIVESHDYHDHLRLAAITGQLPLLAQALS
jgi:ketosteroid isomerase-like protein